MAYAGMFRSTKIQSATVVDTIQKIKSTNITNIEDYVVVGTMAVARGSLSSLLSNPPQPCI